LIETGHVGVLPSNGKSLISRDLYL
jgi:hypothetical protein